VTIIALPSPNWRRLLKLIKEESGQTIAEFALILPVFVMVSFCLIDIQWMTKQAANIDYIVNEVARCEALSQPNPTVALPCNPSAGGVSPHQYALNLARVLRLDAANLTVNAPSCDPTLGTCKVILDYDYHPLGVWFPAVHINRTGIASYTPGP